MRVALFAYSRRGCGTAERIVPCLGDGEIRLFAPEKHLKEGFLPIPRPSRPFYGEQFAWADALVFVGSAGIAVREIAPHLKRKTTDPAVLCVDELARFVIPLLSGHIGGANALALELAERLGSVPVVTTATDINGRFSVDAWAAANGLVISGMKTAKEVSAAILERDLPLLSDFPVEGDYPSGTYPGGEGELGIHITCGTNSPFAESLRLIPRILHLGIGCRKGIAAEAVAEAVETVLKENGIDRRALKLASTIDLKEEEEGLRSFCAAAGLPLFFHSAEELAAVPGEFSASDFVKNVTGVDNVCERAARIGADRIIVKKTAGNGVTVALAAEKWEVRFG